MREMVLNHVSLRARNRHEAQSRLTNISLGMIDLASKGVVERGLRSSRCLSTIYLFDNFSLRDAIYFLKQKDIKMFLLRLSTKSPLLVDAAKEFAEKFRGCQERKFSQEDGNPLLFCALTNSIAVGFPSDAIWLRDQIKVEFDELRDDESISHEMEFVDNLTQHEHAKCICQRHQTDLSGQIENLMELWRKREEIFPNLCFGPEVEEHLRKLDNGILHRLIKKLALLDEAAKKWPSHGGPQPPWGKCQVSSESQSVRENPRWAKERIFRSYSGCDKTFELHARLGDMRIHLCLDASLHEVEIGYIGRHLPTQRFPD